MRKAHLTSYVKIIILSICIAITTFTFKSNNDQGVQSSFPYFSGAANYSSLFDWRISPDDYVKVAKMSQQERQAYRYVRTEKTIKNSINNYGYVLVAFAARNLFPWLGDTQAIVLLQALVHTILSLLVLGVLLNTRFQRSLFFLFYAINPFVIYWVTFPFYYFWSVLPSFVLAVVWFKPDKIRNWFPLLTITMLFSLLIRPSTLYLVIFVFLVAFFRNNQKISRRIVLLCFTLFITSFLWLSQQNVWYRSPFHTAYIGVGIYTNPYGLHGGDQEGYDYYKYKTGETINTDPIVGNANNAKYMSVLKQRYYEIVKESPLLLVRNAVLNTTQAFGVGINVSRSWTRPFTVGLGLLIIGLFIFTKQWVWGLGIFAYAIAFTLYYPPIAPYLFGANILVVLGLCLAIEKLFYKLLPKSSEEKVSLK